MKQLFVIFCLLLAQTAFAQRFDLQMYKPDHAIQEEVNEWRNRDIWGGYMMGFLWQNKNLTRPFLSLIKEADRYLLRVEFSSMDGVYVTDIAQYPYANFEDTEGNVVTLQCDPLTPVVVTGMGRTISNASPIIGSTWYSASRGGTAGISAPRMNMVTYTTILSYVIPDLEEFSHHQFVKASMCDGGIEYDLREGGTKVVNKFNKQLQKAVKHVAKLKKPSKIRIEEGWTDHGFTTSVPGMPGFGIF